MELSGSKLKLGEKRLKIADVFYFLENEPFVEVSAEAIERAKRAREFLEERVKGEEAIYGVNTGFGRLAGKRISSEQLDKLQLNLIRSHASGVGEPLPIPIVTLSMLLQLNSLARGHSGVSPQVLEFLASIINLDFRPVVPEIGSLGASGDLAPLAHIAHAFIGEGEVFIRGEPSGLYSAPGGWERISAQEALNRFGLEPLKLSVKEGLSLINSTAVSQATLLLALKDFSELFPALLIACALSHEAYGGGDSHFSPQLYAEKCHRFSVEIATLMLALREGSALRQAHLHCEKVQDPYSLRCFVPVASVLLSTFSHLAEVLEVEMNSSTDNPLVFVDDAAIISGANFHGEALAESAEACALAIARSSMMSERRVNQILHPGLESGLPPFLAGESGVESGLMLLQYVDSALVAEINHLAEPAILTNVPVSGDQEDFVSLCLTAAKKLASSLKLFGKVLAIELLVSLKGVQVRCSSFQGKELSTSAHLLKAIQAIAQVVEIPEGDASYSALIENLSAKLLEGILGPSFFTSLGISLSSVLPWL